jgi:hypothetical protein
MSGELQSGVGRINDAPGHVTSTGQMFQLNGPAEVGMSTHW